VKNYLTLLHKDEYLRLSGHQRAVLHGLWLAYASARCQLRLDTASLSRRLSLRVSSHTMEVLNHAGFIEFSASKPLASRARVAESEVELQVVQPEADSLANKNGASINPVEAKLLTEIHDCTKRTELAVHQFALRLPDAALATALESLQHRRSQTPPLVSEARYVVATLKSIEQERQR
jgi:hypothetical protein